MAEKVREDLMGTIARLSEQVRKGRIVKESVWFEIAQARTAIID